MKNCDRSCYEKYKEVYDVNLNNTTFDYGNFKGELDNCVRKCDDMNSQVLDHQIKGAEISYVFLYLFYFM